MVLIMVFINQINVFATKATNFDSNEYIVTLAPYLLDENVTNVKRGDCITIIMKVLGVDDASAGKYAGADYCKPVFYDLVYNDENSGYIIIANFADVAKGVRVGVYDETYNFEPNRDVTVRECLTFMLRCLKKAETVEWENVVSQAVETGLLQAEEAGNLDTDKALTGGTFRVLLERMLNMHRYLYWADEESQYGGSKSMKFDETGTMRYVDWICQKKNITQGET